MLRPQRFAGLQFIFIIFGYKKPTVILSKLRWTYGGELGIRTLGSFWEHDISSLVRTWHFRVCCGRWRQFWKRRKPLRSNGFRTRRPVLTSFISEKTRVQIEMESAPKRSIFCALARKYARRKPLSGMALRTASPD